MKIALLMWLVLPASAHALKCKETGTLWTADAKIAPDGYVVANATFDHLVKPLAQANVHFLADGKRVEATVVVNGTQAIIRPKAALSGTVKLAGLPGSHWPVDQTWRVVERKAKPATWTADPALTGGGAHEMGAYGLSWHRKFSVPVAGVQLVHFSARPGGGDPVSMFLKVDGGEVSLNGGPCGGNLPPGFAPGEHEAALRPVGVNGGLGDARPIRFTVPKSAAP